MKYLTMTHRRNMRLRREISRALRSHRQRDLATTIGEVLRRPLTRGFYIEADSAIVTDRRRRAGKSICKGEMRAAMWDDFFRQVDAMLADNPRMSRVRAICTVIATGTSHTGFGISHESALNIYNHGNQA